MSIKHVLSLLFISSLCVVACSKENVKSGGPIEVKLKGQGECLSGIGKQVTAYFAGELGRNEVESIWNCISSSVNEFERLTAGDSEKDTYSPEKLRDFFQKYFFKDKIISNELLDSVMALKRLVLSGSEKSVTRAELLELRNLLGELKALSLILHPHVQVLFGSKVRASDAQIRGATTAMRVVANQIGARIYVNNQSYTFRDMFKLLDAVDKWTDNGDGDKAPRPIKTLKQAMIALPEAKRILVGGSLEEISGYEWINVVSTLGQIYNVYLAASVSMSKGLNGAFTREILPENLDVLVDQLSQSVQNHDGAVIPMREWRDLFDKIEATKLLPENFTAIAMYDAFAWMVRRPMGRSSENPSSFTVEHIASLRKMLSNWSVLLREPVELVNSAPILTRFKDLINDSPALQWDGLGRLVFSANPTQRWTDSNRKQMVFPFVALDWFKSGYVGQDPQSVSFEEFDRAAVEVLALLQNFGWLLDSDSGMGKRRFFEANLFMPSSDGDDTLSLSEATRYAVFVLSSYLSADHWLKLSDTLCATPRDAKCVRDLALDRKLDVLSPLPLVRNSHDEWGDQRFLDYLIFAEKTIIGAPATGKVSTADLLRIWQLMNYVEVYMQRFDSDGSDRVSLDEILKSYPLYGPVLKQKLGVGGGIDDVEILAFFTFLMKYGDLPFSMFGGPILYENWKWNRDSWYLAVERDTLMAILAALSRY